MLAECRIIPRRAAFLAVPPGQAESGPLLNSRLNQHAK